MSQQLSEVPVKKTIDEEALDNIRKIGDAMYKAPKAPDVCWACFESRLEGQMSPQVIVDQADRLMQILRRMRGFLAQAGEESLGEDMQAAHDAAHGIMSEFFSRHLNAKQD